MEKKREELLKGSILKLFVKYFIPTLIGSAAVVLYNIVDSSLLEKLAKRRLLVRELLFILLC